MQENEAGDEIQALTARYVFPAVGPPIANGVVTFQKGRIIDVGPGDVKRALDLGNVAIMPGLVNAHVHLEFSSLRATLGYRGISLVEWIGLAISSRGEQTSGRSIEQGLLESRSLGTTSLGDIVQEGWPVDQIERANLDVTVFQELIAPTTDRIDAALQLARRHIATGKTAGTWRPGLSPHAPYSVHPDLLDEVVAISADERVPLAFHLAESREELQWLRDGSGPFREFLDRIGALNPTTSEGGRRPLDFLRTLDGAHRALIVHGNYLDGQEIAFLAEQADRMAVVYCPRTHAWFDHRPYPLTEMLAAGVHVALGTDSRASAPDLSMLAEMRQTAKSHPAIGGDMILQLATLRAAEALGRDAELGSLESGKAADFAVVRLPDHDATDPHALLFESDGPIAETWIAGRRVFSDTDFL